MTFGLLPLLAKQAETNLGALILISHTTAKYLNPFVQPLAVRSCTNYSLHL